MALKLEKDCNTFIFQEEHSKEIEWIKLRADKVLEIKVKDKEEIVKHKNVTKLEWDIYNL